MFYLKTLALLALDVFERVVAINWTVIDKMSNTRAHQQFLYFFQNWKHRFFLVHRLKTKITIINNKNNLCFTLKIKINIIINCFNYIFHKIIAKIRIEIPNTWALNTYFSKFFIHDIAQNFRPFLIVHKYMIMEIKLLKIV